jgi:hypothetical protein
VHSAQITNFNDTLKVLKVPRTFRLSAEFHSLSLRMLLPALSGLQNLIAFCIFHYCGPVTEVAHSLLNLFHNEFIDVDLSLYIKHNLVETSISNSSRVQSGLNYQSSMYII